MQTLTIVHLANYHQNRKQYLQVKIGDNTSSIHKFHFGTLGKGKGA